MASTYTTNLRLEKQADGENSSTWGQKENATRDLTEDAIAGFDSVAFTSSDVTLTANSGTSDQSRKMMLKATGTLSANVNMVVPAVSKMYIIWNATSGAFTLTVKTASGTGVTIESGKIALVFCDGTNVSRAQTDLTSAFIKYPSYHVYTANSSTSFAINYNNGALQEITLTGNVTFTLTNPPSSGTAGMIRLVLKQDATGSRTITWPASIKWTGTTNDTTAPTLGTTANYYNIVDLYTRDGGTTWVGARVGGGSSGTGDGSAPSATAGIYVAVGSSGKLTSSTDGVTWTLQSQQFSGTNISFCKYVNGRFHFGSDAASGNAASVLKYTTNGTTFTAWQNAGGGYIPRNIHGFSNNNIILEGAALNNSAILLTTTDGGTTITDKSLYTSFNNNDYLIAVNGLEGMITAPNDAGGGIFAATTTGIAGLSSTLTQHSPQPTGIGISLSYANGYWLLGRSDGTVWYKATVTSTTLTSSTALTTAVKKVIWSGAKWITIGASGKISNASVMGTWTSRTTGLSGNVIDITVNSGVIIAITDTGEIVRSTNDGDTWTAVSGSDNPFGGSALTKVKYKLTQWMISGAGGKFGVSTDGTSFTLRSLGMGADTINDFDAV